MSDDFAVAVKLWTPDGTTQLIDFNDHDLGLSVVDVGPVDEAVDRAEVSSPFVNGRFSVWERDDAGTVGLLVGIEGATWAAVETSRLAMRTAYRRPSMLLDVTLQGVTTRHRARRPDVTSERLTSGSLAACYRELLLTFPVQPNPTVSGA